MYHHVTAPRRLPAPTPTSYINFVVATVLKLVTTTRHPLSTRPAMSIAAGPVHKKWIPIEIWEGIFEQLIWDPVLLHPTSPRHNISHYYHSRGLKALLRQTIALRRVCRYWDATVRGLISIAASGDSFVPHYLQFRRLLLVDCEHLQLPRTPLFTYQGRTITSLRLRIKEKKDAKQWLVATSSLSALRCLSFHLCCNTKKDFLTDIAHQWPNLQSLSCLYHSPRSWASDVKGVALLALETLELSTPTIYDIGEWTLPSLKHLYVVILSCDDFKLYSPLFHHGPKLVTLGISSAFINTPGIAWDYLSSLVTLEFDFHRCDLLMPLKFGESGVLVDDSQLNFTKVINVGRKNYNFWQASIAEWVLGVYNAAPKQDKILAFADTWEDVRETKFFEHLTAQAKYCAERGVRFEDLLERTLEEVGSTLSVEKGAEDKREY